MKFCISVGVLLVVLVGCAVSQDGSCKKYGDCDPGPNCLEWSNSLSNDKCYSCCNGGYINKDQLCDGNVDCTNGTDEDPEFCSEVFGRNLRSGKLSCFAPKHNCSSDKDCCSKTCRDGTCWDERCG